MSSLAMVISLVVLFLLIVISVWLKSSCSYLICSYSVEQQYGLHVDRAYAGKFVSSMEMAGFSLTLMLLNNERLQCLGKTVTFSLSIFLFLTVCALLLWSLYVIGQTIIFSSCSSFLSSIFFFFPRLISAAAHWMSTILPHILWP